MGEWRFIKIGNAARTPLPATEATGAKAAGARIRPHRSRSARFLVALSTGIALVMLLPLAYLIYRAGGVGWERSVELLLRPRTLQIIWNSLALAGAVTLASLVISLPMAWLTVRSDLPGKRIWTVLAAMPLVIPTYVGSFAIIATLGPRGMFQELLQPFGVERFPPIYGFPGALMALTLFSYPYLFLSIRAGLVNQDPAIEEAARSLGRNAWQTFFQVTLPNLRPAITAGGLLGALYTLSDFGAVSLLRYNSFTRAIYIQYLSSFDRSLASLLALALVFLTVLILFGERYTRGRIRYYRSSAGSQRRRPPQPLGLWRWPALIFMGGIVAAALFIPTTVIVYWMIRGLISGEAIMPLWIAAWHSVQAGLLAALATVILALPVAYYSVRRPSKWSAIVSQSVYLGYGLPGIVIALSLVFFGANFATALYQTLAMLIFAYVVRFLPQALGSVQSSLLQVSPRLEEAGRSLGLNSRGVVRRITIPLLRPGIMAGAALVFLTTIKELPATLLLGPTGFNTLATEIWSATDEAFFARAAGPALLLLAVSALSILLILSQESTD